MEAQESEGSGKKQIKAKSKREESEREREMGAETKKTSGVLFFLCQKVKKNGWNRWWQMSLWKHQKGMQPNAVCSLVSCLCMHVYWERWMHILHTTICLSPSVMFALCRSLPLPCHDWTFYAQADWWCVQSRQSLRPSVHDVYSRVSLLCMTAVHSYSSSQLRRMPWCSWHYS